MGGPFGDELFSEPWFFGWNLVVGAMAGDRGLLFPELTASAVAPEAAEVHAGHYDRQYSNNLTCEIGMTQATGLPYVSLLYLVEEASRP
ncbi:MAG TPA: hypothetical protein VEW48_04350 [Thermoanaerobaculia bacterium]|nr:hypothetical protein [Thermoanaerobaculia bacterium]